MAQNDSLLDAFLGAPAETATPATPSATPLAPASATPVAAPVAAKAEPSLMDAFLGTDAPAQNAAPVKAGGNVESFVRERGAQAAAVAQRLGVSPAAVLAQWGLETGWGKSVIPGTRNLGNIKDPSRRADSVFAYDKIENSNHAYRRFASDDEFNDSYADLLTRRYKGALNSGEDGQRFFSGLKAGGYATDKDYVQKGMGAFNMVQQALGKDPQALRMRGASTAVVPGQTLAAGGFQSTAARTQLAEKKNPGMGDYLREFGASAAEGFGSIGQFVGEGLAKIGNAMTGTEDYESKNLAKPAADALRDGMSDAGKAAKADAASVSGDLLDPSSWQAPNTLDGWIMTGASGFGSLIPSVLPFVGPAARAAKFTKLAQGLQGAEKAAALAEAAKWGARAQVIGAGTGGAMTGGSAAEQVRDSVAKAMEGKTHEQLLSEIPAYATAFEQTGDERTARNAVINSSARWAAGFSAVAGAAGGAFNAHLLEDFIVGKGVAAMVGNNIGSRAARTALTGAGGAVGEGLQEASEQVGQNVGENIGKGVSATKDVTRDTFGPALGGALVGGPVGAVGGATTSHKSPQQAAVDAKKEALAPVQAAAEAGGVLSKAAMAGNSDAALNAQAGTVVQGAQQEQAEAAAAAAPKPDPLGDEAATIATAARQPGFMDKLRTETGPQDVKKFVQDLSIAQSPNTQPAQREQALGRLRFTMDWAGMAPAAAGPNPMSNDVDVIGGTRDLGSGVPSSNPTTATERRAGADRDKDLQDAKAAAGTDFDRQNVEAQAQVNRERRLGAAPQKVADAGQKVASASHTLPSAVNPQPSAKTAEGLAEGEQERLEAAALTAKEAGRVADDKPRLDMIDAIKRRIEARGGVASQQEADDLRSANAGTPYDRIDPALATPLSQDEKLTQATGIEVGAPAGTGNRPRSSTRYSETQEPNEAAEREAVNARSPSRQTQIPERQGPKFEAQANPPAGPVSIAAVTEALSTAPALRTAEQKVTVDGARRVYTPQQMAILQQSIDGPFELNTEERLQLEEMKRVSPSVERSDDVSRETAGKPAVEPVDKTVNNVTVPTYQRKRKAHLRQLVDNGFTRVEREGSVFKLTNPKTKQSINLDGPSDAALARAAAHDAIRTGAELADQSASQAQKEAGVAKKGRVEFDGLSLAIENQIGSTRSGTGPDGTPWSVTMTAHYGDVERTKGNDGDAVDVYLAPNPRHGAPAFVFDQYNDDGDFDETKTVLGVQTQAQAEAIYDAHFSDGSGPRRRRAVTQMSIDEFKAWAKSPEAKKPAAPATMEMVQESKSQIRININGKPEVLDVVTELPETSSAVRGGEARTISRKQANVLQGLAKIFGKTIIFVDADKVKVDGFVRPDDTGAIFMNKSTSISPMALFGHELLHLLKRDNPQAHAALEAAVKARMGDAAKKKMSTYYDDSNILEELTSDLGGDMMTDPKFWEDVFARVQEASPGEAKGIMAKLAAWVYRAVNSLLGDARKYGAADLVTDAESLREAFKSALATYIEQQGITKQAMQADVMKAGPEVKASLERFHKNMGDEIKARREYAELMSRQHDWAYEAGDQLMGRKGNVWKVINRSFTSTGEKITRNAPIKLVPTYILETGKEGEDGHQRGLFREDRILDPNIGMTSLTRPFVAKKSRDGDVKPSFDRQSESKENLDDQPETVGLARAGGPERGSEGAVPSYGTAREGSVAARGVHFSQAPRATLDSERYGQGLKGAEAARLQGEENDDVRPRTFFYVDKGEGVQAESGIGAARHEIQLNNLYDIFADPQGIVRDNPGITAWERAIMQAGFDGYLANDPAYRQGFAVLVGKHKVPTGQQEAVKTIKRGLMAREIDAINVDAIPGAKLRAGTLSYPESSAKAAQDELSRISSVTPSAIRTPAFDKWFGDSKAVQRINTETGKPATSTKEPSRLDPLVMYHTTTGDFSEFEIGRTATNSGTFGDWETKRHAIFLTPELDASEAYGKHDDKFKDGARVMPVFIRAENPLDLTGGIAEGVAERLAATGFVSERFVYNQMPSWSMFDDEGGEAVSKAAQAAGYDSIIFNDENPDTGNSFEAWAVFDPSQIKSATGNNGAFDSDSADITASRIRNEDLEIEHPEPDPRPVQKLAQAALDAMPAPAGSSVRFASGEQNPKLRGTGKGGKPTVFDVANFFQKRNEGRYPDLDSKEAKAAIAKSLAHEALHALTNAGNAVGWYDRKVKNALRIMATKHPELLTDPDARFAFTVTTAITSNGQDVFTNFKMADQIYARYKKEGKFPLDFEGGAKTRNAMISSFDLMNEMMEAMPGRDAAEYMAMVMPVKDIMMETGVKVAGEKVEAELPVAVILGPKIGSFYGNLNGYFDTITMDKWFMRTVNRIAGQIIGPQYETFNKYLSELEDIIQTDEDLKGFKEHEIQQDIDDYRKATPEQQASSDFVARQLPNLFGYVKAVFRDYARPQMLNGKKVSFAFRTDQNKNAKKIFEAITQTNEAPANGSQRAWVRDVINGTQALMRQAKIDLSNADLQAVLWYYEKDLYQKLGVGNAKAESADYTDAATAIVGGEERRDAGEPGSAQQDAGELDDGSEEGDSESGGLDALLRLEEVRSSVRRDPAGGADTRELQDGRGVRGSQGRVADARGQAEGNEGRDAPLSGLPTNIKVGGRQLEIGPFAPARRAAEKYMADRGLEYSPPTTYAKVDPERAERIAEAYEAMEHAPRDPEVVEAYNALIDETMAQYEAALAAGLQVEFIAGPDPYAASPRLATEDVRNNNHMWVYGTRDGFGSNAEFDPSENPLLRETKFEISGQKALANDIFRVVHDYFGHVKEGVGFRADGEENAWRSHAAMFTPLARKALTTETRGQNSWVNYGPAGEANRTASAGDTVFADQKVNLLPDWVTDEGREDVKASARREVNPELAKTGIDEKLIRAYLKMVNSRTDDSGLETPAEKARYSRARNALFTLAETYGSPASVVARMAAAYDMEGGERALWAGDDVKASAARTDTPAFKEWFGSSKMRDENGEPKVYYHMTPADLSELKPGGDDSKKSGPAIWLSPYSDKQSAAHNTRAGKKDGTNVMPLYVKMERPLMIDDETSLGWARDVFADGSREFPQVILPKWADAVQQDYDGIVFDGDALGWGDKTGEAIVFKSTQVKSAIGNDGSFDAGNPDVTKSAARAPVFFSQLDRVLSNEVPDRLATQAAPQWTLWLKANAGKFGVKAEELEWSGIYDMLKMRGKDKLTREELAGFVRDNGVKIGETVLGAPETDSQKIRKQEEPDIIERDGRFIIRGDDGEQIGDDFSTWEEADAHVSEAFKEERDDGGVVKYETYTVPGGKNYREVLITLPSKRTESDVVSARKHLRLLNYKGLDGLVDEDAMEIAQDNGWKPEAGYRSNHWEGAPNILAHLRLDDRTDADGSKVLFVNEIQSDWGQEGKKNGFAESKKVDTTGWTATESYPGSWRIFNADGLVRNNGVSGETAQDAINAYANMVERQALKAVPKAPFVTDTKSWVALAMKRAIVEAARGGYEKVAFINGEQAADLYDLSKRVRDITFLAPWKEGDMGTVKAYDHSGNVVVDKLATAADLPDIIGKETARKLLDQKPTMMSQPTYTLSGDGIKVGGEGMHTFYDQIVPQVARDLAKKLGGKVDNVDLGTAAAVPANAQVVEHPDGDYALQDKSSGKYFVGFEKDGSVEWHENDHQSFGTRSAANEQAEKIKKATVDGVTQQLAIAITPEMRSKVEGGVTMFSRQRSVQQLVDRAEKNVKQDVQEAWRDASRQVDRLTDQQAVELDQLESEISRLMRAVQANRKGNDALAFMLDELESGLDEAVENDTLPEFVGKDGADAKAMRLQLGEARFSKSRTTGDSGRAYTPEQLAMFKNIGRTTEEKSIKERLKEARQDIGKKMAQGIVDQFRPIKDMGGEGYTLARLSKGAAGAFEALLHHGKLKLTDNVYDADQSGGFIEKVGNPLGAELEDFMQWIAANRAEQLTKEDREHLFTAEDIAAGKSLADGQLAQPYQLANGSTTTDRKEAYQDSLVKFNEFNKNAMDMAEQSGLIDGEARKLWESEFYVPFYRVSEEDGAFMGTKIKGGIARQQAFKKLKGGKDKLNSDLLSNTLQNWAHLIDAAAKNRAAKATLETAQNVGVAIEASEETVRQMGKSTGNKNGVVWFMDGGKQRHFLVEDPYLLTAINSLEYAGMKGPLMDALSAMKHWLTVGVTASPAFKIRNLIRDSISAIGISGLSYNPIKNLAEGAKATARDSQTYVSTLASGGLIRFGTMMEGNASERIRRLVRRGVHESTILNGPQKVQAFYDKMIDPAIQAYHEIGNRGEEINRAALYSQLRAQGKGHAEASLMARDLMDFSMQGTWTSIRFLTQVVPFMNARLQGLYKLGRGAAEDPKRFAMVTGAVALVSVALMAAYGDDDDWKKREDFDRDNFWWFKFGGTAFRVPKPFEIGAIATLAERGVELFTNDEFTTKRFADRLKHIVGDNLAMNPIPQAVKPIIDVYANKDSFSGRPIESMGMERLKAEYRYNANTSMVARGASTALNAAANLIGTDALSPVQVDSLLRGYFGWLGTFVVGGADMAVRPMTNEPTRPQADVLRVVTQGFLRQLPEQGSKYVSSVYEQATKLEQAYATYRQLKKDGKVEEAKQFAEDNKADLARYKQVEGVKKSQTDSNKKIREIERSDATPGEKRDQIQVIREKQSKNAQPIY